MSGRREYLTIRDLCEELEISRDTFYRWRSTGRAPLCTKLPNGELRICRDDFESWLHNHKEAA
ncbi:helix-turn-helix domain-containing protein [Saccharopolyspora taberi]|uniref:Helix-turn-helix domain-containing protein n=1 Tax=Saccharopolyspora taberi TaxID=60895 RepID=A0ABN3V4L4_9PSEU